MQKLRLFLALCFFFLVSSLSAQCPPGERHIRLEIDPDQYWYEPNWSLTNQDGTLTYAAGSCPSDEFYTFDYCVPEEGCLVFSMKDTYGDAMIPDGFYRLYINDTLVHENIGYNYHFEESIRFDCPQGSFCDNPFPIDTGSFVTPTAQEAWYRFVPADTGSYQINTCDPANLCGSKIWVYDFCQGIVVSNDQTGAIFYADGGCSNGAVANLYLAGGKEYFLRLRYIAGSCNDAPLHFSLTYEGPVVGCTDPAACNYNPLATITDTCYYPGSPLCTNAPDLVVLEDVLRNSMYLEVLTNGDACLVEEGCIRGLGNRNLVRFTTHIQNNGTQDYFIGETPATLSTPSDQFVWDPCHNHWHYRGYAEYLLYDNIGGVVPVGSKNGFCVLDLECNNGGQGQYSCSNMGITAGCGDIYDAYLPCQWVDITGIPAGTYTLVVRVNWDKSPDKVGRIEKTYENNWGQGCFNLSYNGDTPIVDFLDDACPVYTDCTGEPYGSALIDCEGVCNGVLLRGDWNKDTLRNDSDVQNYLSASLADNANATECRDLFSDDAITVFDAALLQECNLHADDIPYWGLRFPCQFPTGFENEEDIVYLLPGALDTVAKTFDIQIVNPYNKIIGYEFSVSGLSINSVENLEPGFDGAIQFDSNGEIISLSATEATIKKYILPGSFVRIHYNKLTAQQVCISDITSVVNSKYQQSNTAISNPACVNTGLVGSSNPQAAFGVFVQPNPFTDKTTLFFTNPGAEKTHITMTDMSGRVVRSFENIREESVTLERGNLPNGVYLYTVSSALGSVSGKLILQ